jgi:hypothetical protein
MSEAAVSEGGCPECGSSFYRDGHCIVCSARREHDQHRQMAERSGPEYDKAITRGRAGAAAWRAAGSPARVSMVNASSRDADGNRHWEIKYYLYAPLKRGEFIEATQEQVEAWYAWRRSRP